MQQEVKSHVINQKEVKKVSRTKGIRGVLRKRKSLNVEEISKDFETPEPLPINDYWVYFPIPQKALFRMLLNIPPIKEAPKVPEIKVEPVPPQR